MDEIKETIYGFGILIGTIVLTAVVTWWCVKPTNVFQLSADQEKFRKAMVAISEIGYRSPVKVTQIFTKETDKGTVFICVCDNDSTSAIKYETAPNPHRIPKVGEWWKLGVNWDAEWELEYPDHDKMKEEEEIVDGGEA